MLPNPVILSLRIDDFKSYIELYATMPYAYATMLSQQVKRSQNKSMIAQFCLKLILYFTIISTKSVKVHLSTIWLKGNKYNLKTDYVDLTLKKQV